MAGVGAIHLSEISQTLAVIEREMNIDLQHNMLGSAGKNEFSGDIDVALKLPADAIPEFIARLNQCSIVDSAKQSILVVISKVKIQGYSPSIPTDRDRTGYVQIDFMIDEDPAWLKTFYHSPKSTDSKYKGAHRNIAIGALSQYVDRVESDDKLQDGRPMWVERFMFSSKKGLVRVKRTPVKRVDGKGFTQKHSNKIISGPWKTTEAIAHRLHLGSADNLDSFETILTAIETNHSADIVNKFAQSIADDKSLQKLGIPSEIRKYIK